MHLIDVIFGRRTIERLACGYRLTNEGSLVWCGPVSGSASINRISPLVLIGPVSI